MMAMRCVCVTLALTLVVHTGLAEQRDLEARRKALKNLLVEQWDYTMRVNPVWASMLGDKRWNDKLEDYSQDAIDKDLEQTRKFLASFEAIDTTGFSAQEALNKRLMVRNLRMVLEGARFKPWEMPVSQFGGIHIQLPDLASLLAFGDLKDYEDYIARLKAMPMAITQTEAQMRKGMADGLMPPKYLLEKVAQQANQVAALEAEKTSFARAFSKFPAGINEAEQKRLRDQGIAAIREGVLPAYARFATFVREEYAPKGRTEPGVWARCRMERHATASPSRK
jgi:uncharacterized protein (DUF885 family)